MSSDDSATIKVKLAQEILMDNDRQCKERGEEILYKIIPKRINHLRKLLCQSPWNKRKLDAVDVEINIDPSFCHFDHCIHIDSDSDNGEAASQKHDDCERKNKVVKKSCHMVLHPRIACNDKIVELDNFLENLRLDMIEDIAGLKAWIKMLVPKVEDGNNFGVEVQKMVLSKIEHIKAKLSDASETNVCTYHNERAGLVTKLCKSPHVEDYRQAIKKTDQQTFTAMRLEVSEIKQLYIDLNNAITKNITKILQPKGNNANHMY